MTDSTLHEGHTPLEPCPFCGGDRARTIHIRDGRKVACICGACSKPCFHGPSDQPNAEDRAITAWNTRVNKGTAADAMAEALEALLAFMEDEPGIWSGGEVDEARQALAAYRESTS